MGVRVNLIEGGKQTPLLTYKPTIFLDMDGVLADFDKRANEVLRTDNHYKYDFVHGAEVYWHNINTRAPNFFAELELMPDAMTLLNAVWNEKLAVLTALPKSNPIRVKAQKETWVALNVREDLKVIACTTFEKPNYCQEGDVLIDDRAVNRPAWQSKGGRFILHTSAEDSVAQLREMKVIA